MHDGMLYHPIEGQGQGHEPFKSWKSGHFQSYLLRHLQCDLATDHIFLNYRAQYLNLIEPDFLIFS